MSSKTLLFTMDLEQAMAEIAGLGGRVAARLTRSVLVAVLPEGVEVSTLVHSQPHEPERLGRISSLAARVWRGSKRRSEVFGR